jgi:uncharacterized protein (TIGR02145 family)
MSRSGATGLFVAGVVVVAVAVASCGGQAATPGPPPVPTGSVTDVEGNVYPTIVIGKQEWMVENLKTATYNDGAPIPNATDITSSAGLISDAYTWPDNDVANKDVYGALYNFFVVQLGKLCPVGWAMPSNDDWGALVDSLGGNGVAGGPLKESGTDHWQAPNAGATNQSGFSALPGGERDPAEFFFYRGQNAFWWTSEDKLGSLPATAYFWQVSYDLTSSVGGEAAYPTGFSVRCFRSAP